MRVSRDLSWEKRILQAKSRYWKLKRETRHWLQNIFSFVNCTAAVPGMESSFRENGKHEFYFRALIVECVLRIRTAETKLK